MKIAKKQYEMLNSDKHVQCDLEWLSVNTDVYKHCITGYECVGGIQAKVVNFDRTNRWLPPEGTTQLLDNGSFQFITNDQRWNSRNQLLVYAWIYSLQSVHNRPISDDWFVGYSRVGRLITLINHDTLIINHVTQGETKHHSPTTASRLTANDKGKKLRSSHAKYLA